MRLFNFTRILFLMSGSLLFRPVWCTTKKKKGLFKLRQGRGFFSFLDFKFLFLFLTIFIFGNVLIRGRKSLFMTWLYMYTPNPSSVVVLGTPETGYRSRVLKMVKVRETNFVSLVTFSVLSIRSSHTPGHLSTLYYSCLLSLLYASHYVRPFLFQK